MRCHKVFVVKRDMTDDTQPVSNNAKLEDIAKMTIDIELLNLRISRSMRGHGSIGRIHRQPYKDHKIYQSPEISRMP